MKRKLQQLSTKQLHGIFNDKFATTPLSNEILDLLPERKQRAFIISQFLKEFSTKSLQFMLDNQI